MQFQINGFDRDSGDDRSIVVTAETEIDAELKAEAQNVVARSTIPLPDQPEAPYVEYTLQRGDIICPTEDCGYFGPPKAESRSSLAWVILLTLLGFAPGLLYILLNSGYDYLCPRCGTHCRRLRKRDLKSG